MSPLVRNSADGRELTMMRWGFLTCEPNAVLAPFQPKVMPVILTTVEECNAWMSAPIPEAVELQRPLADGLLSIGERGEKHDRPSASPEMAPALLM